MDKYKNRISFTKSCWNWVGALKNGYGRLQINKKECLAHRIIYQLAGGKIPDGTEIDHLCSNRKCVNPAHLEPVTHAENVKRGRVKIMERKKYCANGHLMDDDNTYIVVDRKKNGKTWRNCKLCKVEANRLWRLRIGMKPRK